MKIKWKDVPLIALIILSPIMSYAHYDLYLYTRSLEREKKAHQLRRFTYDVLLSEPKTRAVMCVRKFKQLK